MKDDTKKTFSSIIDKDVKKRVDSYAQRHNMTISRLIEVALASYVDQDGANKVVKYDPENDTPDTPRSEKDMAYINSLTSLEKAVKEKEAIINALKRKQTLIQEAVSSVMNAVNSFEQDPDCRSILLEEIANLFPELTYKDAEEADLDEDSEE